MRNARSGLVVLGLTIAGSAAFSCHSEPDPRLVELDKRIRAEQLRLDDIVKQIEEAEGRAKVALSEAEYQGCRATAGELRAEIMRRRAMCAKDVADHNLCLALNSKQAAESTMAGCAFGLLLGFFSGGAAAPWALGGCAVAAGSAPSPDCPSIACADKLPELENEVLAERGLGTFPHCGGYFGLSVRPLVAKIQTAIRIERVAPGSTAQSASMAKGDALWMVAGKRVSSAADVEAALTGVEPGEVIQLAVIRDGQRLSLTGTASRRSLAGDLGEHVLLGVLLGDLLTAVPFEAGAQLVDVDPQGPAHGVLQVGDVISNVSTQSPTLEIEALRNLEELRALLDSVRAEQSVTFEIIRGQDELRVEAQAAERGAHEWL